ncbi:MAG: hypothetical protein QHG98_03955 [Methanothrix sp.]|nr:hypothetical protein [Methanothrix sp.]
MGSLQADAGLVAGEEVLSIGPAVQDWLESNWREIFSSGIMPEPEPGCPG